ncbi:FkbM family methyltransferase [Pedobacter duraquae]|uniref:FkbM family methyltransferase n=1 Tax=Pedobacter duraquae TaxID=425511 RepID=UPI001414DB33|nr:FkbM family methyltransferase [Pedobacter duraquae]
MKRRIVNYAHSSSILIFSQEGEDRLLERFIGQKSYGIYIDVGAHHPTFISNTYYFYLKGWRGINIDAQPDSMKQFNKIRPYDINIEQPVSDLAGEFDFHIFNKPELNTFDEKNVAEFLNYPDVKLIKKVKLHTVTLERILDDHLAKLGTTHIDFLNIDVEGYDLKVLKSNNWIKYSPQFVLTENLFSTLKESFESELTLYMNSVNYTMIAKTVNTVFFRRNE